MRASHRTTQESTSITAITMAPKESKNSVTVAPAAFVSMLLHASKHCHDPVHGVLIGSFDGNNKVQVKEAVPVCHGAPTQPLVETALALLEQQMDKDTNVVGWYTSPRLLKDDKPGPAALKIVSGLATTAGGKEPALLVVRNEGLGLLVRGEDQALENTLKALGKDFGKQWLDPLEIRVEEKERAIKAAREAIQSELNIEDLTDHFEADPKASAWYPNEKLRSFVEKFSK